jgi:TATA-binding protein-associated factor Taf7
MFKIADISQMLVVSHRVGSEAEATRAAPGAQTSAAGGGERSEAGAGEYVWDSGLTPPMHLARKRRFRKRANKRVCVLPSISRRAPLTPRVCRPDHRDCRERGRTSSKG